MKCMTTGECADWWQQMYRFTSLVADPGQWPAAHTSRIATSFDSRPVPVQEVEQNPLKVPYDITAPAGADVSLSVPPLFAIKAKRESRATRSLLVEWTAEVVLEGDGYRVAGTGKEGTLNIPKTITSKFPAVLSLRVVILNANGKAYTLDKAYRLIR